MHTSDMHASYPLCFPTIFKVAKHQSVPVIYEAHESHGHRAGVCAELGDEIEAGLLGLVVNPQALQRAEAVRTCIVTILSLSQHYL